MKSNNKDKEISLNINEEVKEITENFKKFISQEKRSIMGNDLYKTGFFSNTSKQKELVKRIIEVGCDIPYVDIKKIDIEEPLYYLYFEDNQLYISHSVRYDIRVETKDRIYYIIEFQRRNNQDNVERFVTATSYQVLEQLIKNFSSGESYNNIPKPVALIFTDFDVLGINKEKYDFKYMSTGEGIKVSLPFELIFFDTRKKNDKTELGRLFNDLTEDDPDKIYNNLFKERAKEMITEYRKVENSKLNSILDGINKELRKKDKKVNEIIQNYKKQIEKLNEEKIKNAEKDKKSIKALFESGVSKNVIADSLDLSLEYVETVLNNNLES